VWPGDVLDFLKEKKAESIALFEKAKPTQQAKSSIKEEQKNQSTTPTLSRDEQKEIEKNKKRLQTLIQKSEKEIESLENKIKEMDVVLAELDYTHQEKANKTLAEYDDLKKKLEEVMQQWENASEELSALS